MPGKLPRKEKKDQQPRQLPIFNLNHASASSKRSACFLWLYTSCLILFV
jgi:hypothetical protein